MKMLLTFAIATVAFSSQTVLADRGVVDYCICYHKNGDSEMANLIRNKSGKIVGAQMYSTNKVAISYNTIKDPYTLSTIVSKFYKGKLSSASIGSAEAILIAQQASTGRERNLIIFRDKKGSLVSMTESNPQTIRNCSGDENGTLSRCAANDGSVLELTK